MNFLRTFIAIFLTCVLSFSGDAEAWSSSSSFAGNRLLVVPSSSSLMTMVIPSIEKWRVLKDGSVTGTVKNHPSIDDGDTITTSPLKLPGSVKSRVVVETQSGSKYRLGVPAVFPQKKNDNKKAALAEPQQTSTKAKPEFGLTGETIGDFLLAGKMTRSTSGKSQLWQCYQKGENGLPVGDALMAKISPNIEALRRESGNYERATSGLNRGQFVKLVKFLPQAGGSRAFKKQGALVMERGDMDLKAYIADNGPLIGRDLRDAAVAAVQCLQAVHSSSLVWTDLKTENFVIQKNVNDDRFVVKGIDLESAMPYRDNPVDYSPEACPPEFADAFLSGEGPYFILDYTYDTWSFGMMLFEISTGNSAFKGKSPSQITKILRTPGYAVDTSSVDDEKLRDLVDLCLRTDPKERPSLAQILLHPYFLSTGVGPFSF